MKSKSKTAPAPKIIKAKKKILVVDDDPEIIALLDEVLTGAGYEVVKASFSLPALFQVVRDLPDLILVDINMPIMNGLELIENFKRHADTREVPIVVISGMDSPEAREVAKELGAVGFLPKPFDVIKFPKQVAKYLKA